MIDFEAVLAKHEEAIRNREVGQPCCFCGRTVQALGPEEDYRSHISVLIPMGQFCSEFCSTTSDTEKLTFLELQPDEWGIYPCMECACAIEDQYVVHGVCGTCGPISRLKRLLKECEPHLPLDLRERVKDAVRPRA